MLIRTLTNSLIFNLKDALRSNELLKLIVVYLQKLIIVYFTLILLKKNHDEK